MDQESWPYLNTITKASCKKTNQQHACLSNVNHQADYQRLPYNLNIYTVGYKVLSAARFALDQLLVTNSSKGQATHFTWFRSQDVYIRKKRTLQVLIYVTAPNQLQFIQCLINPSINLKFLCICLSVHHRT